MSKQFSVPTETISRWRGCLHTEHRRAREVIGDLIETERLANAADRKVRLQWRQQVQHLRDMGDHEELRPVNSGRENMTLEQIGQHFGITEERARQNNVCAMNCSSKCLSDWGYPYQFVRYRITDFRLEAPRNNKYSGR